MKLTKLFIPSLFLRNTGRERDMIERSRTCLNSLTKSQWPREAEMEQELHKYHSSQERHHQSKQRMRRSFLLPPSISFLIIEAYKRSVKEGMGTGKTTRTSLKQQGHPCISRFPAPDALAIAHTLTIQRVPLGDQARRPST